MRFHRVVAVCMIAPMALLGIAARRGFAASPDGDTNALAAADAQILAEVRDHSEAMQNLEYISDSIGPRLTGSPQLKQANDWTAEVMARYGSERIRGHGIPEAIEAILMNGSRVEPKVALLKPISSAISIGSGGPFGAEGPIIMMIAAAELLSKNPNPSVAQIKDAFTNKGPSPHLCRCGTYAAIIDAVQRAGRVMRG